MSLKNETDCCSGVQSNSSCPLCNERKQSVTVRTLKHWLQASLVPFVGEGPYYFCGTKDCPIVYFSGDHSIQYTKKQLRDRITSKEVSGPHTLCYCFGVSEEMISEEIQMSDQSTFSSWIEKEVKNGVCACEVRSPTGRCCLSEIKKTEMKIQKIKT